MVPFLIAGHIHGIVQLVVVIFCVTLVYMYMYLYMYFSAGYN